MAGSSGGATSSSRNSVERFYLPPHSRRQQQQRLRSPTSPSLSPSPSPRSGRHKAAAPPAAPVAAGVLTDGDSRVDSDDSSSTSSKPSVASTATATTTAADVNVTALEESGNLERFLTSTTPSVPFQYLPKLENVEDWRLGDESDGEYLDASSESSSETDVDRLRVSSVEATHGMANDSDGITPACPGFGGISPCANATGKLSLPAFGLASYKLRSSIWASDGTQGQRVISLMEEAGNWLSCVQSTTTISGLIWESIVLRPSWPASNSP
uniref:Uncharacterized protein n=1 Tax=Oryza punctata TaxID=4537 RepID=A0A0E0KL26_ORYPU